jgi:hypothetical protein
MRICRLIGVVFFAAVVTCFVSTQIPASAGDKGADAKQDKDKDKDKGDEKKPATGGGTAFKAFDGSDPFYQEVRTETTQLMTVQGQEVTQKQEQTFYIEWTPRGKDKDGNYEVVQKVIGVKMKIDIGGNNVDYDSTIDPAKQQKNQVAAFFDALMSQPLTFTISSDLEVKKIDGRTEFIKKLADTNPAIKTLLDTIMSENALKKMADPTWFAVPPSDGRTTWTVNSELKLGGVGNYHTTFRFNLKGSDKGKDTIDIKAELKHTPPGEKESGLPFKIRSASVAGNGKGTAVFDRNLGRIESSTLSMKLAGDLTIEVGEMTTDIKLDQTQTSTCKTSSSRPLLQK